MQWNLSWSQYLRCAKCCWTRIKKTCIATWMVRCLNIPAHTHLSLGPNRSLIAIIWPGCYCQTINQFMTQITIKLDTAWSPSQGRWLMPHKHALHQFPFKHHICVMLCAQYYVHNCCGARIVAQSQAAICPLVSPAQMTTIINIKTPA